jgi:hypothetical protein
MGQEFPMQPSSLLILVGAVASTLAIAASCGGTVAPVGQDDDGGSDAASASDAGDAGSVRLDGGGGKDTGGGQSCDVLRQQIDRLREAATRCCPTCKSLQCQDQAQDLCCPASVTSASSPDAQKLEAAAQSYAKQGCDIACTAMPCRTTGSGICDPVTSHCQQ